MRAKRLQAMRNQEVNTADAYTESQDR